jgi:2-O-(6-phospho-alpha-D-mannosyl)-D-glycerate hydrolase
MARPITFHLIPHMHWDREWYRTSAAFGVRLVPAVAAVLELLERDADARFTLDGQTILLDDVLRTRPEWELPIARLVHGRRLDVGPWYILADELLPAGESLVRNLLAGARASALWGRRADVLYSPDAFGHPAMLPALAAEFGIAAGVV